MNPKVCLALALAAFTQIVDATFIIETAAAGTAAAATAVTLSTTTAASLGLLGGLALVKGLAIGALAKGAKRGKRFAVDDDDSAAFYVLAQSEPAKCYRRLICDLATGTMPKSENDVIMKLFDHETSIESPKFEYATAAKLGKQLKRTDVCELRYSCPLSSQEIQKLLQ